MMDEMTTISPQIYTHITPKVATDLCFLIPSAACQIIVYAPHRETWKCCAHLSELPVP